MLKEYCRSRAALVDAKLLTLISDKNEPTIIFDAMRYSLMAGGKRLRPILLMAAADAVGARGTDYLQIACGLEMIHTYSLIHDDLPAMDNDDYRRGKLTNHKIYGEGMAILAGDGLLTAAFEVMLEQPNVEPLLLLRAVTAIAHAAGPSGMVGGQALDLISEGKQIDAATLKMIHQGKTGALFTASLRAGAIVAGAKKDKIDCLTEFGHHFGLAFQITDDILDVTGTQELIGKPVGSDEKNQKATYVSLFGLEKAKTLANEAVKDAKDSLSGFGSEANILRELTTYLLSRNS